MKHSIYNYHLESNNLHYLYNGLSGACVSLSAKEYDDFCTINITKEDLEELMRLGFLIEDGYDEADHYLRLLKEETEASSRRFYRILTTTECNARCHYCYEKDVPKETMDDRTAEDVAEFIISTQRETPHLFLQFFGGEPLCNPRAIDIITSKIKAASIPFSSSITTNGFFLNKSMAKKAKTDWNVKKVQITLDGTKEVYERIKGYKSKDAFERVITNIRETALLGIRVNLRLNYSEETKEDIIDLIHFLSANMGKDVAPNINVYAYRLFENG